jgi:hypothetical protein
MDIRNIADPLVFRNIRNVRSIYRLSQLSQHFLSFATASMRIGMLANMDVVWSFAYPLEGAALLFQHNSSLTPFGLRVPRNFRVFRRRFILSLAHF